MSLKDAREVDESDIEPVARVESVSPEDAREVAESDIEPVARVESVSPEDAREVDEADIELVARVESVSPNSPSSFGCHMNKVSGTILLEVPAMEAYVNFKRCIWIRRSWSHEISAFSIC